MNILFLSTWCPFPPDNGSRIRAHYLLRALATAHRITLAAFCPNPVAEASVPPNVSFHPVRADPFRYVKLPKVVRYLSPVPLVLWRIEEMVTAVRSLCRQQTWDAVVGVQGPTASYTSELPDVPSVLDVDTSLSHQLRERCREQERLLDRWCTRISWYKANWYESALFGRFGTCTVASRAELDSLRTMVGSDTEVAVVPNGVDCVYHHPGLARARANALIYNGALTYGANYDAMQHFLANIYPLVKAKVPAVTMRITGSTHGVDLGGLELDDSVHFTGYVDDVRIPVAQSSVCVVPLRRGGGTRLKILESMALGTPVVATSKGAEGLDVVNEEHILLADTPEDFARRVIGLLNDPAQANFLTRNARQLVEEHYDWDLIGARFVDLVSRTVHQGSGGPHA